MALRINTNVAALNAHRVLTDNDTMLNKSLARLSSGLRINGASDDAAGLAISQKMEGQTRGLDQASRNAQDGISLIQTAEGAMQESQAILQRMRELAVQGANDTLTTADRSNISDELSQLSSELDRISTTTEFNTKKLINGDLSAGGLTFQIGANAGQTISFTLSNMSATSLSVSNGSDISVGNSAAASTAISKLDAAINTVSNNRSKLGALINRLQHTIANLGVASENLNAANSRVKDLDMAKEVVNMSKAQILSQSSTAMLSQANQSSQGVLGLLR
ncbi:MAG TPA: flagellin [Pantanalinema sp.]